MNSPRAVLGVVVIFLMGVSVGGVGVYFVEKSMLQNALRGPEHLTSFLVKRVSKRLDFTEDQKQKLMEIVKKSRGRLKDIRKEVAPRVEGVFRDAEEGILVFLRPEQKKRFEKMIRMRKNFFLERDLMKEE